MINSAKVSFIDKSEFKIDIPDALRRIGNEHKFYLPSFKYSAGNLCPNFVVSAGCESSDLAEFVLGHFNAFLVNGLVLGNQKRKFDGAVVEYTRERARAFFQYLSEEGLRVSFQYSRYYHYRVSLPMNDTYYLTFHKPILNSEVVNSLKFLDSDYENLDVTPFDSEYEFALELGNTTGVTYYFIMDEVVTEIPC